MTNSDAPWCFVFMPFGTRTESPGGATFYFDLVYEQALKPGISDAGLRPIRADEEELGGIIHETMFERLLICDYAVADLTAANPNVLYELGVRHTARPHSTLSVYAESRPLPFNISLLRTLSYELGADNRPSPEALQKLRRDVQEKLTEMRARRGSASDSPLFKLVAGWNPRPLPPEAAASFHAQTQAAQATKTALARVRSLAATEATAPIARAELQALKDALSETEASDNGVMTAVLLAHRALGDWAEMVDVYEQLSEQVRQQVLAQQLIAFAYGRLAENPDDPEREFKQGQALSLLTSVEKAEGPSSETYGLRGRIYKARWRETRVTAPVRARGFLNLALDAYLKGFEADPRDFYPGINAVILLQARGTEEDLKRQAGLLPVVRFAVDRAAVLNPTDYWARATRLELAVLEKDEDAAQAALEATGATASENWQRATTIATLDLLQDLTGDAWVDQIKDELRQV